VRYRTLGTSGLRVSDLILGAMTFGEQGGVGAPLPECRRMLDLYAEAGGNVLDTAINYRAGASEEFLGELLKGRQESFVLGTKYTVSRDRADPNAAGNHRKNLRASLETSLRRLRTDYVDLYWVHMWDRDTPSRHDHAMTTAYGIVPGGPVAWSAGERPLDRMALEQGAGLCAGQVEAGP
jgi:aryl-alcohol dehydrogenase-like predicted oxidoreductase